MKTTTTFDPTDIEDVEDVLILVSDLHPNLVEDRLRAATARSAGPTLADTNPHLITALEALFDEYGPAGVQHTVLQMIERARQREAAKLL